MTSPQQPPPPLLSLPRPNALREEIDLPNMTFEKNVDIPLKDGQGLCRGNVYRPKGDGKWPVLLTCESPVRLL
jgi:predicted acyl esterase